MFIVFGALLTYSLLEVKVYLETLGFVSVFTEAMLGAPQFYRNYKNQSTEGMRLVRLFCICIPRVSQKTGDTVSKPVQQEV